MSHSAIHSLPHEITAKIFGYLPPKSLIHRFARASKSSAKLVQDVLSEGVAEHNSLNILVTGLPGAGSTTLYNRLRDELNDVALHKRNLSESIEISSTPPQYSNGWYSVDEIKLQNCHANIVHGSTKKNQSKSMYAFCGACQAIVYVVPCMEQFDEYFAQNLVTYHSLTYNVEWIFVINKMDQVQYSEQAFNNCVERIKKTALKVLGQHRMDRLHFIPMSANDMSMRLTGDTSKEMTWHTGLTLWNALNSVANESSSSIFKLFRKLNVAIVQVNNRLNKPNIVIARVYVIEGCVSIGDKIQVFPSVYKSYVGAHTLFQGEVKEIQSHKTPRALALPNSFVGMAIRITAKPARKFHFIRYPEVYVQPKHYHYSITSLSTHYRAVILNISTPVPNYKWNGLVSTNYTGAIHSLGIRGATKVARLLKIWDGQGNEQDLNLIKEKRKCLGIEKGEKAEVLLSCAIPLDLTCNNNGIVDDARGRFLILTQKSHVVVVGTIREKLSTEEFNALRDSKIN